MRASRGLSPWSPAETWRALALVAVGFAVVAAGWWSLADEAVWDRQITAIGAAVAGFAVGAFGAVTWLLRGRALVVARRRRLLPEVAAVAALAPGAPGAVADEPLVADPERGRFHRASCLLAAGKGWPTSTAARLAAAGREPCGVCRP